MKTSKGVLVARVSTSQQDLKRQILEIENYCEKNDIHIVERFTEKESGTHEQREELSKLINFCSDERPDFVICSELSRLGRTNEVLNTINTFNKLGVCLISLKENVKTLNPDKTVSPTTGLLLNVLTGISNFELSTLSHRFQTGKMKNRKSGKSCGDGVALGYTVDKETKFIQVDEETSKIVKLMFDLYLKNYGVRNIAIYLNEQGYTTKRGLKFTQTTVYQTLTNENYIGKRWFKKGTQYEQVFSLPSIIDVETFEKVQEKLKSGFQKFDINKKNDYLLNNRILICGCCNSYFVPKNYKEGKRYVCNTKVLGLEKCNSTSIHIDTLEKSISNMLVTYFPNHLLNTKETDNLIERIKILETILDGNQNELNETEKLESKILDWELAGRYTQKIINEKLEAVKVTRKKLYKDFKNITKELEEIKRLYTNKTNFQQQIENFSKNGVDKNVLKDVVSKIVLTPYDGKISNLKQDKTIQIELCVGDVCLNYLQSTRTSTFKVLE